MRFQGKNSWLLGLKRNFERVNWGRFDGINKGSKETKLR